MYSGSASGLLSLQASSFTINAVEAAGEPLSERGSQEETRLLTVAVNGYLWIDSDR